MLVPATQWTENARFLQRVDDPDVRPPAGTAAAQG